MALFLVFLLACTKEEEVTYNPTVSFLSPAEDASVAAGDVSVSIVVDDFVLTGPADEARVAYPPSVPLWLLVNTAEAHNEEGMPAGYAELALDGVVVAQLSETQDTLPAVAAGEHDLTATLFFADGDDIGAEVATVHFTAE